MNRVLFAAFLISSACGGDGSSAVDAHVADSRVGDASMSACGYTEQSDDTNDDVNSSSGVPETTTIAAPSGVLCGAVDSTHFDGDITVDVDSYNVTAPAETDVLVRISGDLASIELVAIDVYPMGATTPVAKLDFYGNHGVTSAHLAAGTYTIRVQALAEAAIPATLPYTLELSEDTPATRCPSLASATVTESGDGSESTGNDMVAILDGSPPALTDADDLPEPTSTVLASSTSFRVDGTAADVTQTDQYEDKDTFAISTGSANELTVRLDWPTAGADLDWLLFEAANPTPVFRATGVSTTGPELRVAAVKPNASYWLLVGAKAGSSVPATYSATICGAKYQAP